MIFQDPISLAQPAGASIDIVSEPLTIWKIGTKQERVAAANAMLDQVGIDPFVNGSGVPCEFSGGPVPQRINCIARALVMKPKLPSATRSWSALDVLCPSPDTEPSAGSEAGSYNLT